MEWRLNFTNFQSRTLQTRQGRLQIFGKPNQRMNFSSFAWARVPWCFYWKITRGLSNAQNITTIMYCLVFCFQRKNISCWKWRCGREPSFLNEEKSVNKTKKYLQNLETQFKALLGTNPTKYGTKETNNKSSKSFPFEVRCMTMYVLLAWCVSCIAFVCAQTEMIGGRPAGSFILFPPRFHSILSFHHFQFCVKNVAAAVADFGSCEAFPFSWRGPDTTPTKSKLLDPLLLMFCFGSVSLPDRNMKMTGISFIVFFVFPTVQRRSFCQLRGWTFQ